MGQMPLANQSTYYLDTSTTHYPVTWVPATPSEEITIVTIFVPATWTAVGTVAAALVLVIARHDRPRARWLMITQVGATAGLFALLSWQRSGEISVLVPSTLAVTTVPLALIDARSRRLPNRLVFPTYVTTAGALVTVAVIQREPGLLLRALLGALVLLVFYGALYAFVPGGIGGGDVKMAGICGAVLAWHSWSTIIAGLLFTWTLSMIVLQGQRLARSKSPDGELPHGPSLVIGTFTAILILP